MDCSPTKVYSACDQVRKNVGKGSRVIFYYNGHGAMSCSHQTSENGKSIWVVNASIKHYIVVPLATLMDRVESPAIYIWDCDHAGKEFE